MKLTGEESIHLSDFPKFDKTKVNEKIEKRMDLVRDLISLGRNAREEAKIKVRQPINEVILDGSNESLISDLTDLIKEELNVKNVSFVSDLTKYMTLTIKPNYKVCGKMFGKDINNFANELLSLSQDNINKLQNNEEIEITFNGEKIKVNSEMVDIRVNAKEGFDAANMNNNFIIIDTKLNDELINEGIAREIVSKVQNLRKEYDFDITDRINLYYNGDIDNVINDFKDYIMKETLALSITKKDIDKNELNINEFVINLDVEKIA